MKRCHAKSDYNDLSYLIGMPLALKGGIVTACEPDGGVVIIEEYPKTVLVELTFIKSFWGLRLPPRKRRVLVPKAAMRCGDVLLKRLDSGELLTGEVISGTLTSEEAIF